MIDVEETIKLIKDELVDVKNAFHRISCWIGYLELNGVEEMNKKLVTVGGDNIWIGTKKEFDKLKKKMKLK